jgi:type VI secretion system protein VasG
MTSNAGTDLIHRLCADSKTRPDPQELAEALRPELLKLFKPAFLGRCSVIPYFPLADDIIRRIVSLQLDRIRKRYLENYRAELSWNEDLVSEIASRCTEVESGARNIEYILSRGLLPQLSAHVLSVMAEGGQVGSIVVSIEADGRFRFVPKGEPYGEVEDTADSASIKVEAETASAE